MIIDLFVLCARRGMAVWIISSGIDAICEKTDNEEFLRRSALHQEMMCAGGVFMRRTAGAVSKSLRTRPSSKCGRAPCRHRCRKNGQCWNRHNTSADGNHREVKPVLDGGKAADETPRIIVFTNAIGRGKAPCGS